MARRNKRRANSWSSSSLNSGRSSWLAPFFSSKRLMVSVRKYPQSPCRHSSKGSGLRAHCPRLRCWRQKSYTAFSTIHGRIRKNCPKKPYIPYIYLIPQFSHTIPWQSLHHWPTCALVGNEFRQLFVHFQLGYELVFHKFHVGIQLLGSGSQLSFCRINTFCA